MEDLLKAAKMLAMRRYGASQWKLRKIKRMSVGRVLRGPVTVAVESRGGTTCTGSIMLIADVCNSRIVQTHSSLGRLTGVLRLPGTTLPSTQLLGSSL
jgi:hypothetical protein